MAGLKIEPTSVREAREKQVVMMQVIEFLAVLASGTYGILLARRKKMDFVGIFSVASITAFGGGTLRDLFLDRHPLFWIENARYPVIIFVLALGMAFVKTMPKGAEKILYVPDALGLGLFSIVGAGFALESGTTFFIAALLGVITGTFGGVMGDVICNEVPSLFGAVPLYATCSFLGCWVYLGCVYFRLDEAIALSAGIVFTVALRLVAVRLNWMLPLHE